MIAYYVHDEKKEDDLIILPQMGCRLSVDPQVFQDFISVAPSFSKWSGDACGEPDPADFGTVLATREEGGDVCVLKQDLWQSRMRHYLDEGR